MPLDCNGQHHYGRGRRRNRGRRSAVKKSTTSSPIPGTEDYTKGQHYKTVKEETAIRRLDAALW